MEHSTDTRVHHCQSKSIILSLPFPSPNVETLRASEESIRPPTVMEFGRRYDVSKVSYGTSSTEPENGGMNSTG
jgi:hypothetical protein